MTAPQLVEGFHSVSARVQDLAQNEVGGSRVVGGGFALEHIRTRFGLWSEPNMKCHTVSLAFPCTDQKMLHRCYGGTR